MRRYLQGTLDYCCGIYAVLNTFSALGRLDLPEAKQLFEESLLELAESPALWAAFVRNRTDHYFVVRGLLNRLGRTRRGLTLHLPFTPPEPAPSGPALFAGASLHLPENHPPSGPPGAFASREEATAVWKFLSGSLGPRTEGPVPSAAILRFHRFLPGVLLPVVSHWTCAFAAEGGNLLLHDASGEKGALMEIQREDLLPENNTGPRVRIVPESVVLVQTNKGLRGL